MYRRREETDSDGNLVGGPSGDRACPAECGGAWRANLCGKLLGELGAAYLGLNAAAFSSYGSEKRGSPVKSYVRWSVPEREILHNSPVERPHLLVMMGRTKHLCDENYSEVREAIQREVDHRWKRLKALSEHPAL